MRYLRVNVLMGGLGMLFGVTSCLIVLWSADFWPDLFWSWDAWILLAATMMLCLPCAWYVYLGYRLARKEEAILWQMMVGLLMALGSLFLTGGLHWLLRQFFDTNLIEVYGPLLTIASMMCLALYLRLMRPLLKWRGFGEYSDGDLMPRTWVGIIALLIFSDVLQLFQEYREPSAHFEPYFTLYTIASFVIPVLLAWAFYKIMIGLSRSDVNDNKAEPPKTTIEPAF